jgi:hypothetical protein
MKKLFCSIVLTAALAGCPVGYSTVSNDPCEYQTYQNPACGGGGYEWTSGYYNPAHIWIVPHYRRRTVIVPYVRPSVYVGRSPVTTVRTTYVRPAPRYQPTVTRSVTRPNVTVTRTRIR